MMFRLLLATLLGLFACAAVAEESLVTSAQMPDGEAVPYVLNANTEKPKYVFILFPGGAGVVDPHMEDGKLVYQAKGNFLLRARTYFVDDEFATVATNSTQSQSRVQALIDDLNKRFPGVKIYLMGTSRGTYDTVRLAPYLSERIAGVIHTSSMHVVAGVDAKEYKNRQLIVHHRNDGCKHTLLGNALRAHEKYGTDLIVMEGGISTGDACQAFSHHGYNGIEKETAERIKAWVKQGG